MSEEHRDQAKSMGFRALSRLVSRIGVMRGMMVAADLETAELHRG
jgi:hypothetical protein